MSSTMKISLLALVSTVAAVPQYGYGHSKFHSLKPSATEGYGYETAPAYDHSHGHSAYGTGKPYPTGGYPMGRNSTRVPHPTGGYAEGTTTIDVTSTSTKTVVKTVHVSPSPAPGNYQTSVAAVVQAVSAPAYDQCGPATVTVTASEKVTVTVGDYEAPSSMPVKASSAYVAPPLSSAYVAVPPSSAAAAPSSKAVVPVYSAPAPKPVEPTSSKAVVPVYSAPAPKPVEPTSSKVVVPVYTSAAPAPKPTPSAPATGLYSGTKRGLAYNDASLAKNFAGKYGFAWNWAQTGGDVGTMYIPTMHKPSDSTPEAWLANVDKAVKAGSTAVMGFNECDISTQCAMAPADACAAWKQYMNPIKAKYPSVTIIGPSVSNSGSPSEGLDWLTQFHSVCPDAIVDATNIHFYSIYQDKTNTQYSTTIERLQTQVETAAKNYGMKVWLTEYGLNPGSATADQAATFLQESLTYLDNAPEVQGYSYFMVGNDQSQYQLCEAGAASPLGKIYSA